MLEGSGGGIACAPRIDTVGPGSGAVVCRTHPVRPPSIGRAGLDIEIARLLKWKNKYLQNNGITAIAMPSFLLMWCEVAGPRNQ